MVALLRPFQSFLTVGHNIKSLLLFILFNCVLILNNENPLYSNLYDLARSILNNFN